MCITLYNGAEEIDTLGYLKTIMPIVIKFDQYSKLGTDDGCLCGVDIEKTCIQNGLNG